MTESVDRRFENEIARLSALDLVALRKEWARHFGGPIPKHQSIELMRRRLAYELQVKAYGGLKDQIKRRMHQYCKAFGANPNFTPLRNRDLKPGSVLNREWKGEMHNVQVLEAGFEYCGKRYESLSEVASAITGSKWSGPQFFRFNGR